MPIYTYEFNGKTYDIENDTPPTEAEVMALVSSVPTHASGEQPVPEDPTSLWDSVKSAVGTGLKGGLEVIGRPGEAVSGFVGGYAKGGFKEGLKRAGAAAFEPNIADSKIQESFSKVMEEQGVLKDSPWIRAGVGFAADVVTDPLNLLGGAGILRRGVAKGLTKAGLSAKAADVLTAQPVGRAFQNAVVKPTTKLTKAAISGLNLGTNKHELSRIVGKSGITAADVEYLSTVQRRVADADALRARNSILSKYKINDAEDELLSTAMASPTSAEAQRVQALIAGGETRLAGAMQDLRKAFDDLQSKEIAAGIMPATKPFTDIPEDLARRVDALSSAERIELQNAFRTPGVVDANTGIVDAQGLAQLQIILSDPKLKSIAHQLVGRAQRESGLIKTPMVDFTTLSFEKGFYQPTGTPGSKLVLPTFSTKVPNYVPQFATASAPDVPQTLVQQFQELTPALSASKSKTRTWEEAIKEGSPTKMSEIFMRRHASSNRALANTELLQRFADDFGEAVQRPGTRVVNPTIMEYLPEPIRNAYKGKYVPDAVAERIEKVTEKMNDPQKAVGAIAQAAKLFKVMATTYNFPGHQVGNFIGNATNFYSTTTASMPEVLKGIAQATRALKGKGKLPAIDVPGGRLSGDDILALAKKYGIGGDATGFAGEITAPEKLTETARAFFGQEKGIRAALNPDAKLAQKIRDINQNLIEDPAKLAMFHYELAHGKSVEEAALSVRTALFDYNDLTDFERKYARAVIPFYTWTRKNIPLQLANMAQRPAKLSHQRRLLDLAWTLSESDDVEDVAKEDLPSYLTNPDVFPIVGAIGSEDKPVFGRARLPMMDLGLLSPDEFAKRAGFMLTPPVRAAIELYMNKRIGDPDYRTIRSQRDEPAGLLGRTLGTVAGAWDDPELGPRQEAMTKWWQESVPVPFGAAVRTIDSAGRENSNLNPFLELLLRSLSVAPSQIDEDTLARARGERTRRAILPQ